jgi:hypothetical protein
MIKSYKIIISSITKFRVCLALSIITSGITPAAILFIYDIPLFIYLFLTIIMLFVLLHLSKKIYKKDSVIIVAADHLEMTTVSIFNNRKTIHVMYDDITSYLYDPTSYFSVLQIKLDSGGSFKIYHKDADSKIDEFNDFKGHLIKSIKQIEKVTGKNTTSQKLIYQTTIGKISAVILAFILVAIPVIYTINKRNPNWGYLLALYSGGIYFIFMVYSYSRKR